MVCSIKRVGIDFRFFFQIETRCLCQLDGIRLGHITGGFHHIHATAFWRAVLNHTQNTARFEGPIKGFEVLFLRPGHDPVVHIAEGQHHVCRARRSDFGISWWMQPGHNNFIVDLIVIGQFLAVALQHGWLIGNSRGR